MFPTASTVETAFLRAEETNSGVTIFFADVPTVC